MDRSKLTIMAMISVLVFGVLASAGCGGRYVPPESEDADLYARTEDPESPKRAWALLREGNARFVSGETLSKDVTERRAELEAGQEPFAVIVTCSDSRVPPELVFDQGLGDLFVVRVAGNVVDPVAMGSIEYGVEHLEVPLVVVMGHSKCGAVTAAVEGGGAHGSVEAIIEMLAPSVAAAKKQGVPSSGLVEAAGDLNVTAQVAAIRKSPIVREREEKGEVEVVAAKYLLSTGAVDWSE